MVVLSCLIPHLHLSVLYPPVLVPVLLVLSLGCPVIDLRSEMSFIFGWPDECWEFGPDSAVHHELTGFFLGG